MNAGSDPAAEQIAQRGHQELRRRLQAAIEDEARREDGGLRLAPGEVEPLVSRAAQRAGAALWRRSLAQAGSEILGIGLGDAVGHPAVRAAHEIVGAPPFEDEAAFASSEPAGGTPSEPDVYVPPEPAVSTPAEPEVYVPPAPEVYVPPAPTADTATEPPAKTAEPDIPDAPDALRVEAVHMGGIDSLRIGERDLELRLSADGIDVLKRSSGAPIGHLLWSEIERAQTPRTRHGLRRVQELHLDTPGGRASFELPGVNEDQLTAELEPVLARYLGAR